MTRTVLLALLAAFVPQVVTAAAACRAAQPLRMRVHFADDRPRDVLVESLLPAGLRLLDPGSGDEIWSAGAGAGHTQQFPGMEASFGESLTPVDLDADGVPDRLYAGDRAGRLWRFDLRTGAPRTAWMQAMVLADLGVTGGGRGFVAPADVSLAGTSTGTPWLAIAIGTANTGVSRNDHRFYVLRDSLAAMPEAPLVEADLEALRPPAAVTIGNVHGYYLQLGTAQVLAQSLTLNGNVHFTAVESAQNLLAACDAGELPAMEVPMSVTALRASDGALAMQEIEGSAGQTSTLRREVANPLSASIGPQLAASAVPGLLSCMVGPELLPGCFLDTRPKRSWWRREDAD